MLSFDILFVSFAWNLIDKLRNITLLAFGLEDFDRVHEPRGERWLGWSTYPSLDMQIRANPRGWSAQYGDPR